MLLSIQATALKPILSSLSKVIDNKDPMPIRENIYLHEQDGKIIATAGNDSHTLHCVLPFDRVEDFSPICIPFKQLSEITAAVGDSIFPMELKTGKQAGSKSPFEMVIDYGEGEFRFIAADPTGYPVQKVAPETFQCQVPARQTFACASAATAFTAKDDLRPVMTGVYFDFRTAGELRIVSSDSKALYMRTLREGITPPSDCGFILSPQTIATALSCIGTAEQVSIAYNGKAAIIQTDTFRLEAVLIEGRYPRYETILPKTQRIRLDVPVKTFVTAVRRAAICANQSTNQIRFDFVPSQLYARVSATDVDMSKASHTSLALPKPDQVTDALSIGFRANIVLNAVGALPTADMQMCMNDSQKACTFESTDRDTIVLVMPMMLTE